MLEVRWGAYSGAGDKAQNQDCHAVAVPDFSASERQVAIAAVADGISSSQVSQYASELAINQFIRDFPLTSELWSAKRAVQHVIAAINTRLYVKTQTSAYQDNPERGYVCTFSAVIIEGERAVIIHCGDSAIYHIRGNVVTSCTTPHRAETEFGESVLNNALGITAAVTADISYVDVLAGDYFVLMTDGIDEFVSGTDLLRIFDKQETDLNEVAHSLASLARTAGSRDNLTASIIEVVNLNNERKREYTPDGFLPFFEEPYVGTSIDNWLLISELSRSERSLVFLARDKTSQEEAVIKLPSEERQGLEMYLDSIAKEEWLACLIDSPHVIRSSVSTSGRSAFYTVFDFVNGPTLRQWFNDHGLLSLQNLRNWSAQIVTGLNAMHRNGILHQDIRPENIIIDSNGILKIIDLGSASYYDYRFSFAPELPVAEGDLLYCAPEYIVGLYPDERTDQFSLAVTVYYLLTGHYPYGSRIAQLSQVSDLHRVKYQSAIMYGVKIPLWVDTALKRACHVKMHKRYSALSEFLYDLSHPNPSAVRTLPLIEKHPVRVWQGISACLLTLLLGVLLWQYGG